MDSSEPVIGREEAIARALALLARSPVVTIAGGAGIGKTTVARAVAARSRVEPKIVDGRSASPASLRKAIAAAVRRGHRVLVTAYEPIGIEGEATIVLGPLGDVDALALFASLADDAAGDASALVALLDGVPLAIELAARRTAVMTVDEIVRRMDDPIQTLGDRLERSVAASFERLAAEEQRALVAASVFERSFTAEAFEEVVGPVDLAQQLLDRSLLHREPASGAVRLRMLRPVRAFARAQPGAGDAIEPHARWTIAHAESLAERTYGPGAGRALDDLEALVPDVLAAIDRTTDAERIARAWVALFDPILFRDCLDLRDPRLDAAVAFADRTTPALAARVRVLRARARLEVGPPGEAERDALDAIAIAEASAPNVAAEARRTLGWALIASGAPDRALDVAAAALDAHARCGDVRGQADAIAVSGLALSLLGRREEASQKLALAHAIHAGQKDDLRRGKVEEMIRALGGEIGDGVEALRASAERHAARGQRWREAIDLGLLARIEAARGAEIEAEALRVRARAAAAAAGVAIPDDRARPARGWALGPEARFAFAPDGARHDLARHGPLRRILEALFEARLTSPGIALSADALLDAGWPEEKMRHDAGLLRVYSIVRRLRAMGFADVLLTRDDGYLLDTRAAFSRTD